jgi:uncharacterized protein with ATP-grasp and redox domains
MHSQPTPIRTDESNVFAHYSMNTRVPNIIREIQGLNPDYTPRIQDALTKLRNEIEGNALIPLLDLPALDHEYWAAYHTQYGHERWLETEWFKAEVYAYRMIIQAVRWWETQRDPFLPKKHEELSSPALWDYLELALSTRTDAAEMRLTKLLHYALWSNRVDLSYKVGSAHGQTGETEDLLVDNAASAVDNLLSQKAGSRIVHIIADNAGTEHAADCALIEGLLDCGADQVVYHVKAFPTFVSDTTVSDALSFLSLMESHSHRDIVQLSTTLKAALESGRLRYAPDLFWNSSSWLHEVPSRLSQPFSNAALVIAKGDLNYRRAIQDTMWNPEVSFDSIVSYFPAPLLLIRTFKCDAAAGIDADTIQRLDIADPKWRINGRCGVIQYASNSAR